MFDKRELKMRILKTHPLLSIVNGMLIDLPAPSNLSYFWGFGSLLGLVLVIQLATGIFLAMHYTANVDLAFISVEHIMRDVNYGWVMRYAHANGASMFFIMVYLHIGRGLYYGSYTRPREMVWGVGVVILIAMMATAFIGYVLPWGQMSFWGATVITNLFSAIPLVGDSIVSWLWGGFSVDNATLNRFFSLHYLLPFVIAGLVITHLVLLHQTGNNNPLGVDTTNDKMPFYPYCYVKDLFVFISFAVFFSFVVYFYPNVLGHSDNYIPANPLVTPAHIVPEWYFLPFYAILRSIPDKLGGVVAMVGAILILLTIPFTQSSEIRSSTFRPLFKILFWIFVADFLILGWIGQNVVEYPFVEIGQIATAFYFAYFLIIIPFFGYFESYLLRMKLGN